MPGDGSASGGIGGGNGSGNGGGGGTRWVFLTKTYKTKNCCNLLVKIQEFPSTFPWEAEVAEALLVLLVLLCPLAVVEEDPVVAVEAVVEAVNQAVPLFSTTGEPVQMTFLTL